MNSIIKYILGLVATLACVVAIYFIALYLEGALVFLSSITVLGITVFFSFKYDFWREFCVFLLLHTVLGGMLVETPPLPRLSETIRNLYFHVPMWFGMIILLFASLIYSILFLYYGRMDFDTQASELANAGVLMGVLGLLTGMIWANYTWGTPWHNDPKQLASAISLLMYFAYIILRQSFDDEQKRARISAVYNIICYPTFIVLIKVLPKMVDSSHPDSGGNPAFGDYDLNDTMKLIFYPSIIAWTLLGAWVASQRIRLKRIENDLYENHK